MVFKIRGVVLEVDNVFPDRCRANIAHLRHSRPHSGLRFHVIVLNTFRIVSISSGNGQYSS